MVKKCYSVAMHTLIALSALGAEKFLSNEIKQLGYKPLYSKSGRVAFIGDDDALFRANLCSRIADRIYLQMAAFTAKDFDALYEGIYAINWQDFFRKDVRLIIDKVRTKQSILSSEHTIQSMSHKAIYDKLGAVWKMASMPETGSISTIRIYVEKDEVLVLLDLSGEPLHKRGYRNKGGPAPLRETIAASLLQAMMWKRKMPLHDAFCGSGTIPVEAALYAYNIAPGFGRSFALENLSFYDQKRVDEILKKEAAKIRPDAHARITGTDIDAEAIERARLHAEHACVTAGRALQLIGSDARIQRPDFEIADFRDLKAPYDEGILLSNLPFGERLMNKDEVAALYTDIPKLFEAFPHWQFGFYTANPQFEAALDKKAKQERLIKTGNLNTVFYQYE